LWSVRLADRAPVFRITPADIDGDAQPELLVACGPAGHAVSSSGKLLWSHGTGGIVRDVSLARFAKNGRPVILVSSADTHLYQLDPAGHQIRKDQMTGIYFNADHGERPWGLYCTRAVDTNADGADDLLVTTLASMESQGLTPDIKKLWRTLAAYHGCMEIAVEDVDRDGKPEIVIANKYGAVFVLRPDGSRLLSSSTSIGDVTFGLGDLDGDGRREIVHGSSTGDLIAVNVKNKTLWRFDNYGYPVERIRCADLDGDGRPEVLIASGTGYVYCLDAPGVLRWQRRLGLAVPDLALADGLIVAGTEDGEVHAIDGSGNIRWSQSVGAAVTRLNAISLAGRSAVVAGLADGRLLALATK
jgi:outer membrane protein assembly factor BamB